LFIWTAGFNGDLVVVVRNKIAKAHPVFINLVKIRRLSAEFLLYNIKKLESSYPVHTQDALQCTAYARVKKKPITPDSTIGTVLAHL
jgi:hypothetical protein